MIDRVISAPVEGPAILLAGGGSGGHIFPGLAIAERLVELSSEVRPIFICSRRPIDRRILEAAGAEHHSIEAAPLWLRPRGLYAFGAGFVRSRRTLARVLAGVDIRHLIALGGFVAAPVVIYARRNRIPTTLVNLDARPGKANRWTARRCDRVVTAVPLPTCPRFADQVVGMPVRRNAIATADRATCREQLGLEPQRPTLLVAGGSQGASSINRIMAELVATDPPLHEWQVYHLAGNDEAIVRRAYKRAGARAVVHAFSDRMDLCWGAADLAVSRAGASSVAEASINAVPTLFMPYPHHRDQHQRYNAQPLVDLGGAVLVLDTNDPIGDLRTLRSALIELIEDEAGRDAMAHALQQQPRPDAAETIARIALARSRPVPGCDRGSSQRAGG